MTTASDIKPELEPRTKLSALVPVDYERRAMDLAIEVLRNIKECNGASICVKWSKLAGQLAPMLYIYFEDLVGDDNMPRVHIDNNGVTRPTHAICLAKMPSGTFLEGQAIKETVKRGVEDFLKTFGVRHEPKRKMRLSRG